MTVKINKQFGAVSLFVVVFAALLITVVTVSFVRIMVQNQQQATTVDLSQSAYDSAQAGVEDAKRALLRYQSICNASDEECAKQRTVINSTECNTSVESLSDVAKIASEDGVKVQTGGSNSLDQSYTCVKINLSPVDYLGMLAANDSKIIPLVGTGTFNTVQIEWFNTKDISSSDGYIIDLQNVDLTKMNGSKLVTIEDVPLWSQKILDEEVSNYWKSNRPSLLRTQLIQVGSSGFFLSDFDDSFVEGENINSNANTLFLYPAGTTGKQSSEISTKAFANSDTRRQDPIGTPLPISCSGLIDSGGYACTVKLTLPTPINGGDRTAFLRLSALYNKTNYRVTLFNADLLTGEITPINFDSVQPEIDSTGRANDLFRRVLSRVELVDVNFPYPEATVVETTGDFCKDFRVTDDPADYYDNCPASP